MMRYYFCLIILTALCSGCVNMPATPVPTLATPTRALPSNALPDINIAVFDPGLSNGKYVYPEVRKTEAKLIPTALARTLQNSGAWGAVRVVPSSKQRADVVVSGEILQSDGEQMKLRVSATDATGTQWLNKTYRAVAREEAYYRSSAPGGDPFRAIYYQIANDLLAQQNRLSEAQLRKIRLINDMRFARDFSPQAFSRFLGQNRRGQYQLTSLPADDDPMLQRIQRLRDRDALFVDTLQGHYQQFGNDVMSPYHEWRGKNFQELRALRQLRAQGTAQMIGGLAAIIGGISAAGSDNPRTRSTSNAAIIIGSQILMNGQRRYGESGIHAETMKELGQSLDAEFAPRVISFDKHTVTLTGDVEQQYQQWRDILARLYAAEVGDLEPQAAE